MRIEYTGRQLEVTPPLRELAERKLRKIIRILHGVTHVHVVLAADRRRQLAEVSIQSPRLSLAATEESGDVAVSLSTVIDKLTRQAQRHVGKLRERRKRGVSPSPSVALWSGVMGLGASDNGAQRVIRSRRFLVKPMSVDEAIREVGSSEDGLLVFRDAATSRVSVLYTRKDGNLGLIEPEA
jgi:putative sigma-54 modulation protein